MELEPRTIGISAAAMIVVPILMLIAWLLWPLPSAKFDWQFHASELSANTSCLEFVNFLTVVSLADPDGVESYLDESSIEERCPDIDDRAPPPSNVATSWSAFHEGNIRNTIQNWNSNPEFNPGTWTSIREAVSVWNDGRQARAGTWGSVLAWPDLLIGFRCVGPLHYGSSASWYDARNHFEHFQYYPPLIEVWEQRLTWCREFALSEATKLDGSIANGSDIQTSDEAMERAEWYRFFASEWEEVEDHGGDELRWPALSNPQ